jgi:universal stress protein family protein
VGPVVIVRGFAKEDQGRIAVGIDPGHAYLATLEYAFEAARARGASLRVGHGWRRPETPPESTALPETGNLEEAARWAVVEATAELRRRYPEVETAAEG